MEGSVEAHFGSSANCINCMCHATECLYAYRTTAVGRASDDFYPRCVWTPRRVCCDDALCRGAGGARG